MTAVDLDRDLAAERRGVDRALRKLLAAGKGVPPRLRAAMKHSLLAGGKRLRPVLLLWTRDAVVAGGGEPVVPRETALAAACGLEMIHTYSLIHDDLPAMDDDGLRRGKPTCHVAFDEATAILAGDGLQALGFETLARSGGEAAGRLVARVADAVGPAGMVGGQQYDLESEGQPVSAAVVRRIHTGKTARLLMAAAEAGAVLGGAGDDLCESIAGALLDLGLAFQGADDLLDVTGTAAQLGKTAGKDLVADKATWLRVEGEVKAMNRVRRLGKRGCQRLADCLAPGPESERLQALAWRLWNRDR